MNARNSALHEMFSKLADRLVQAAFNAAFFMFNSFMNSFIYLVESFYSLEYKIENFFITLDRFSAYGFNDPLNKPIYEKTNTSTNNSTNSNS